MDEKRSADELILGCLISESFFSEECHILRSKLEKYALMQQSIKS